VAACGLNNTRPVDVLVKQAPKAVQCFRIHPRPRAVKQQLDLGVRALCRFLARFVDEAGIAEPIHVQMEVIYLAIPSAPGWGLQRQKHFREGTSLTGGSGSLTTSGKEPVAETAGSFAERDFVILRVRLMPHGFQSSTHYLSRRPGACFSQKCDGKAG